MAKKINNQTSDALEKKSSRNFFSKCFHIITKPFSFVFSPIGSVVRNQIGYLIQDFKQDLGRKAVGILFIAVALLFVFSFFLLLSALIIVALVEFAKIKVFYSILIVMGLHLLLVIIFLLIGKSIFSQPMLSGNYYKHRQKND